MLAAAASGSGKTTVTCGILQALMNRGKKVTAFKCGPDYIDPMFHSEVIGAKSRNLDLFMLNEQTVNHLFAKNCEGSDIAVMEGVMGYYDGVGGAQESRASAYHLAKTTKTPVVLIVSCKGMSSSIAALIKGFMAYREDSNIKGIILNQLHESIYPEIRDLIEAELGIRVLGYLPTLPDCALGSRHLGLVTASEVKDLKEKLGRIALRIEACVDMDALFELASSAQEIEYEPLTPPRLSKQVSIGIAYDKAFCFYYQDALQLLCDMGAKLEYFSPMKDKALPKGIDGIILGGGYPEIHAEVLSENTEFLKDLKQKIKSGLPCYAECGGFMYLHDTMQDEHGKPYTMAGVIEGESFRTGCLVRFGYVTLTALRDNMLAKKGESIGAHEFHYWDSTHAGDAFLAKKPVKDRQWDCIVAKENVVAGYPHMHFYSNIRFAMNYLDKCLHYQENQKKTEKV